MEKPNTQIKPSELQPNYFPLEIESNIVPSAGGSVMAGGAMGSPNFATGASGWQVNSDGTVEFDSGNFRGDITGASGTFSGTLIGGSLHIPDQDTTDNSFHVATDGSGWVGKTETNKATAPMQWTAAGALTVSNITVTGVQAGSSIDGQYLAALSVDTGVIAALAIEEGKIAADAVVAAKIAVSGLDGTSGDVSANHIVAGMLQTDCVVSAKIQANAVVAAKIDVAGLDGTSGRIVVADATDANAVTGGINDYAATLIEGAKIVTGSITATQITGTTLSAIYADLGTITAGSISVVAGANTIGFTPAGGNAIFSGTTGSPEFAVTPGGALTCTGATISGALTATTGAIGGWTINATSIYTGTEDHSGYTQNAGDMTLYSNGTDSSIHAKNFYIDTSGNLTCTSATITGTIVAGASSTYAGDAIATSYTAAKCTDAAADETAANTSSDTSAVNSLASTTLISGGKIGTNLVEAAAINVTNLQAISADLGTITAGNITLDTSGFLRTDGKDNFADTTAGIFLGYDTDAYKLNIGDDTQYISWDGTDLVVNGYALTADVTYAEGDVLIESADTERSSTTQTEPGEKDKEIRINRGGTLRIKFSLRRDGGGSAGTCYARIYKNGSGVGTERSNSTITFEEHSEDIADWSPGDLVQLQVWVGGAGVISGIKEFRIYASTPRDVLEVLTN